METKKSSPKPERAELPRISDRLTFIYAERCSISRDDGAISLTDEDGTVNIPAAALTVLLAGPGTTVTHRAVQAMAETGMSIVWVGEQGIRYYAHGRALNGNTRLLLRQAECVSDSRKRIEVARKMYRLRFPDADFSGYKMQQLLGIEGTRVQRIYRTLSEKYGIEWTGRDYDPDHYEEGSDINKALSVANSCLYGVCHAVISALGLSPGLGFIHTGNELSFVHDVSDIYKMELSVPTAFSVISGGAADIEGDVRHAMRDRMKSDRILEVMVDDLHHIFGLDESADYLENRNRIWRGAENENTVEGGRSFGK